MQNLKTQRPDDAVTDSDATSKETLEDLEKKEKSSDSESEVTNRESDIPSPDGVDDEVVRNKNDGGPM